MSAVALLRSQVQAALPRIHLPLTLLPRATPELLSTGIAPVDALLHGGIPRGSLTEIAGEVSSGRATLLHSLLATATASGEFCALIDAHDSFDPASAIQAGMDLTHLLWIRCGGNAEHALQAADRIVQAGGFGLIVFDLTEAELLTARRISLASWFRLRHAVEKTPAALVLLSRQFNARSCSQVQLEMRRAGVTWSGRLLRSISFEVETRKHQIARRTAFEARRFPELG